MKNTVDIQSNAWQAMHEARVSLKGRFLKIGREWPLVIGSTI